MRANLSSQLVRILKGGLAGTGSEITAMAALVESNGGYVVTGRFQDADRPGAHLVVYAQDEHGSTRVRSVCEVEETGHGSR